MDWSDEGIVLSARKHGESAAIVTLLTRGHGRHAGLVRGGAGTRARGLYQIGNRLSVAWRARLSEHLGAWTCELVTPYAARLLDERLPLLALSSAAAILDRLLPEREPHPQTFGGLIGLIEALATAEWAPAYVRWERDLLAELGYGLDLTECAATGAGDDLIYVSPRTGRAVSAGAGAAYADRLLRLPGFLVRADASAPAGDAVRDGLALTGHFLGRCARDADAGDLPAARDRLVARLGRGPK